MNDDTVMFIRHWLLPLALKYNENVSPLQAMVSPASHDTLGEPDSQTSEPSSKDTKLRAAVWQNKIRFDLSQVAWQVKAKKVDEKKHPKWVEWWPVDTSLVGPQWIQSRDAQFRLAALEWNKVDGSKRTRIELSAEQILVAEGMMQKPEGESDQTDSLGTESDSPPSLTQRGDADDSL